MNRGEKVAAFKQFPTIPDAVKFLTAFDQARGSSKFGVVSLRERVPRGRLSP